MEQASKAHDAALRATIEQQAQELDGIKTLLGCHRAYITATIRDMLIKAEEQAQELERLEGELQAINDTVGDTEFSLRQQLAAMTTERDAARSAAREIITQLEAERDAANEARQRAVDSLAKYITHAREDF